MKTENELLSEVMTLRAELGRMHDENERLRAEIEEMRRTWTPRSFAESEHRERMIGVLFGTGRKS